MSSFLGGRGRGFQVHYRSVCFQCDFPRFNNSGGISLHEVGGKERLVIGGGARLTGDGSVLDELISHYENNRGVDLEPFLSMWETDGIKFTVAVMTPESAKGVRNGCEW